MATQTSTIATTTSDAASTETNDRASSLPKDLYNSYMENDDLLPPLVGKTVAITGTTTGIGFALALCAIIKNAALVLLLNRKSERSEESEENLRQYLNSGDGVALETVIKSVNCDLTSFDSVRAAAAEVNQEAKSRGGLDVLCLNAGIMARDDERTRDGFEVQMQTNQLSHFLLALLTCPSLEDAAENRGEARVVTQSSFTRDAANALEARYFKRCEEGTLGGDDAWTLPQLALGRPGPWRRYAQTKLANATFAMALHRRLAASGSRIKSVACEPGWSITPLHNAKHMSGSICDRLSFMVPRMSARDGCLSAAMACFSPNAQSGDLYAPEKGTTGRPIKVVAGGVRKKTWWISRTDKATCDPEQQTLVWEACEKAVGIEFAV